jgi:hypothetical protein
MFWWRKNKRLTVAQLWGLAAGGVLTKFNSEGFNTLRCRSTAQESKLILSGSWGVNEAQQLVPMLEWLRKDGHSSHCFETCKHLRAMGQETPHSQDVVENRLLAFSALHLEELEESRLVGWDLSRLINVARWGYTANYISEADAWDWIILASSRIQASFSSWKALGANFMLGFDYWRYAVAPDGIIDPGPSFNWLVTSAESPWRQLPWKTDLEVV